MAPSGRNRLTANGELAAGAGCPAPAALASSAALSSGDIPNAMRGWVVDAQRAGDVPEHALRPDVGCGDFLLRRDSLGRPTGGLPALGCCLDDEYRAKRDHCLEPIDCRSTSSSRWIRLRPNPNGAIDRANRSRSGACTSHAARGRAMEAVHVPDASWRWWRPVATGDDDEITTPSRSVSSKCSC